MLDKLCYPRGDEKRSGVFVEVGAWDGYQISNTYYLEKCKGWTGLVVEPIASRAESARHNRWCDVWRGCVCNRNGEVDFMHIVGYSEMISGVLNGYHPSYKKRVDKEIIDHKQEIKIVKTPCMTLNTLLDSFNLKRADLLSLDCQTAELQVLGVYDIEKNPIKAILVDFNGANVDELRSWFFQKGYELHWKHATSDEHLYVHPRLQWSWEVGRGAQGRGVTMSIPK